MYPLSAIFSSIQSSILINPPDNLLASTAASSSATEAPVDSRSLLIRSSTLRVSDFLGGRYTFNLGPFLGSIWILSPFSNLSSTTWAIGARNSFSQSQQTNMKSVMSSITLPPLGSISSPHSGQACIHNIGAIFRRKSTIS